MRTERQQRRPADGVVVHQLPIPYRDAALTFSDYNESRAERWQRLGDMLDGRPGWSCHLGPHHLNPLGSGEPGIWWQLGPFGVAVLAVGVHRDGRYVCVDRAQPGAVTLAATTDDVDAWLRAGNRETVAARADSTGLGRAMGADPQLVRTHVWPVTVTHRERTFFATVDDFAAEPPAMAPTLGAALLAAGDLILATLKGAPHNWLRLDGLRLDVRLDPLAAAAVMQGEAPGD